MEHDLQSIANEMLQYEPEFKPGGFVHTHIKQGKSDPLVAIKSAVDRMSELYDLEQDDIGIVSELILKQFTNK